MTLSNSEARLLEASKGGVKVGRIKDPSSQDCYFGITPSSFMPHFECGTARFRALHSLGSRCLG